MIFKRLFFQQRFDNEDGAVLVIALIMLCLMSIIGAGASNTASIETMISGIEKENRQAFYSAEAGVDHAKGLLKGIFVQRNNAKIAAGQPRASPPRKTASALSASRGGPGSRSAGTGTQSLCPAYGSSARTMSCD